MKLPKHNRSRLWLLTALLALALSVTLLASCDRTPGGTDTTEDPSVTVDTPTETDSNGDTVTEEPTEPSDTNPDPIETEDNTGVDTPAQTTGEPPVLEIPGDDTKPDPSETDTEAETLPYDPELHPGDSAATRVF